jgi:ABC-type dipeptide/oligopeptide/nickel transport system permease component
MLMGTVLFSALIIVLMNLIIDISYGFVDPRVCYQVGVPFARGAPSQRQW